jgi:predicted MFS family arabinose efflux permease
MRTFRSLRHRNYRLYFAGQLVSLVGSWTQITALTWLVHSLTKEAKWPAFLAAVQIGPTFLLGPWGGSLADRVPRRGLIIRTQAAFLACTLMFLALSWAGVLGEREPGVWLILGVMFVHGIVQAIDLPARLAYVPGLVGREDLSNAIALNSVMFNVARALGPALAAALVHVATVWAGSDDAGARLGARLCFIVNAVSYLAIILALALIRVPPEPLNASPVDAHGGFRVLARRPGMLTLVLLAGLVAIGGWPLLALLPMLATAELHRAEGGYGTLLSSVGIGALAGALTAASVANEVRRKLLLFGGLVLVSWGLAGLSVAPPLPIASACCVLFGYGMILFFATGQTVVQLGTADADRGKVMGVWAMMLSAGVPLGNLVFGPAADVVGVTRVIAVQAGMIAVAAGVLVVRRVE